VTIGVELKVCIYEKYDSVSFVGASGSESVDPFRYSVSAFRASIAQTVLLQRYWPRTNVHPGIVKGTHKEIKRHQHNSR